MTTTIERTVAIDGTWGIEGSALPLDGDEIWPIAVVQWPAEATRAEHLARERRLRLYIVAPGAEPPIDWDGLSDWIRGPAEANDVYARVEALQRRAPTTSPFGTEVELDRHGLLWRAGKGWVALTPIEEAMMRVLLERPRKVVSRHELLVAAGSTSDTTGVLDARLCRLRRHIAPLGAHIVNVRRRGFLVQLEECTTDED